MLPHAPSQSGRPKLQRWRFGGSIDRLDISQEKRGNALPAVDPRCSHPRPTHPRPRKMQAGAMPSKLSTCPPALEDAEARYEFSRDASPRGFCGDGGAVMRWSEGSLSQPSSPAIANYGTQHWPSSSEDLKSHPSKASPAPPRMRRAGMHAQYTAAARPWRRRDRQKGTIRKEEKFQGCGHALQASSSVQ